MQNPHLAPHTSRPPECNVTERQGGDSATPVIPGEPRLPGPGRERTAPAAPTPFRKDPRNWGFQAAPQLAPREATGLECLGVPKNWVSIGLPRTPSAPTQSFSSRFPGATSLPHTCCPRPHLCPLGSSCWGARGKAPRLRAAAPGARVAPSRPAPVGTPSPPHPASPLRASPLPAAASRVNIALRGRDAHAPRPATSPPRRHGDTVPAPSRALTHACRRAATEDRSALGLKGPRGRGVGGAEGEKRAERGWGVVLGVTTLLGVSKSEELKSSALSTCCLSSALSWLQSFFWDLLEERNFMKGDD